MPVMVKGKLQQEKLFAGERKKGEFIRQESAFRQWITADGSTGFKAEPGRYHLYVSHACPWASRTLMVRALKKLEDIISVTVVDPRMGEHGWVFSDYPGCMPDFLNKARYLHEIYTKADQDYTGHITVPVLWDKKEQTIVNNESSDIIRMLNSEFNAFTDSKIDLYPKKLQAEIDSFNEQMYVDFNNGVYKAGFATTQEIYEEAAQKVFTFIDELEKRCFGSLYLMGDTITECDIRAFVTLIRFDFVYYNLFKCNSERLVDYDQLPDYVRRIYQTDGIASTVNIDHIKKSYYSIKSLNPSGIIPIGPEPEFWMLNEH